MINIETTYEIIIQERFLFLDVLEYIKEQNKTNENKLSNNTLPLHVYEKILEEYLNTRQKHHNINKITNALSFYNLKENNIFSITNTDNNVIYISMVSHVFEMIKNIFKQFDNSLTESHYKEFVVLMREKRIFFQNNNLRKTQEVENEILVLRDFLERVSETLRNTIYSLNIQKQELSKHTNDTKSSDNKIQLNKLKEVRKIRSRYVEPLYSFMDKNSFFIIELKRLINILEERKKLNNVSRTLSFYYTSYLMISQEAKSILQYFKNYIKQTEIELYWNLGSEYLFNKIIEISDSLKDGRKSNFKIWNKQNELSKIEPFFKNSNLKQWSPELIKTNNISKKTFNLYHLTMEENSNKETRKIYEKAVLNQEYERLRKIKEIEVKKKKELDKILINFNKYLDNIDILNVEITDLVLKFLNNNKYDWHLGLFQFLVSKIIRQNIKSKIFILEEKHLTHKNKSIRYKTFYLKEENKDEL